eukprot:36188_1
MGFLNNNPISFLRIIRTAHHYNSIQRFCTNNGSWFRSRFVMPHDTRIIPQIAFRTTTLIFSVIALRMSYIGFNWAEHHAAQFNNRFEKICQSLEDQQNNNNNITIKIESKNTQQTNDKLEKELWKLIEKHYDYDKHNIKCKI